MVSLSLAGCATSAIDMAPGRPDRPWVPTTGPHGDIVPGPAAERAGGEYTLPVNKAVADIPVALQIERDHAYSLVELIDIAQSNNSLTRAAWNNARQAALMAGIASSSYLPSITASVVGAFQHANNNVSGAGVSSSGADTSDGVVSALSIQWLLFDFGERGAAINAAKQASVISNVGFTAAHQQVIQAVSLAYYADGAARAHVETAARSIKNARDVQVAAEERYSHGIGTVVEVAQARQATAQARLIQVQAEGAAQDAYQGVIAAMGISPLTQIKLADIPERELPDSVKDSVEHTVADALGRRPDVLAAYAAQRASDAEVEVARAEFLPKLFVSATAAYNSGQSNLTAIPPLGQQPPIVNLTGNRLNVAVLAGITVPIYDGGLRAATLERARAKADNARVALIHTREEAVRQIVAADAWLRTSLSAHSASRALAAAAQTTFDAALTAYRNGVGSITDATIAETQLLQAKNAETDSYSAALSAAVTLAFAMGSLGSAPR
jgi:outer membrane protein TolC